MLNINLNLIKPKTIYEEGEVVVRAYWYAFANKDPKGQRYVSYSLSLKGAQFYDPKTGDPVDEETAKAYLARLMEAYNACEGADDKLYAGLRFAHATNEAEALFKNEKDKGWVAFDGSALNFKSKKLDQPKNGKTHKVIAYLDCDLLVG